MSSISTIPKKKSRRVRTMLIHMPTAALGDLDRLITDKKRLEAYLPRECNRQTEVRIALKNYIEGERKRLESVIAPSLIPE